MSQTNAESTDPINEDIPKGCGCNACVNGTGPTREYGVVNNDDGSSVYAPSGLATKEQFADYLTDGFWTDFGSRSRQWSQDNVTFSISNSYNSTQKAGIRSAFEQWSDVADLSFTEVSSGGDINIVVGNDGRAYSSSSINWSNGNISSNTISVDTSPWYWQNFNDLGDYAYTTMIHEIGHSLGLGHTGNYNGSASYSQDAIWTNDTRQFSIMSYFDASETGQNHLGEYSSTPMIMDIYAIQQIYGADMTTRTGDTTYGFNSNAGRDEFDFTVNVRPVVAIWDAGGVDTIDLSGFSNTQTINLGEGTFSDVAGGTGNLAIAYGVTIENAVGGTGSDTIYGNNVNNIINGNAGNDYIYGSAGSDAIDGGTGSNDRVEYSYSVTEFAYGFIDSVTVQMTNIANNWTDLISNIESFIFSDGTFTFAELEASYGILEVVGVRLGWDGGGKYAYNSEESGDTTITAAQMGYGGSTGDQITVSRLSNSTTITIEDPNSANVLTVYGTSSNDTILIDGNHADMSGRLYGGGGDDVITVTVTGDDRIHGEAGDDTINAGEGNDRVYGQIGEDILNGEGGNDLLYGMEDNDTLDGGSGNDVLDGGDGADILHGGDDNDRLLGGEGNDTLYGDAGDDRLDADGGNDTLHGGTGSDKLFGYAGQDTLHGGDQNDYLYGMEDNDTLNGDGGNDLLYGGTGDDTLNGGEGNDRLYGEGDDDTLNGGAGRDRLYGNAGDDILNGGAEQDRLFGDIGNDTLNGDGGNDLLYGMDNDDTLNGGDNHDFLYGGNGNDILNGDAGIDRLEGDAGNDTLNGGDHDDLLFGFADNDRLNGDAGADTLYGGDGTDTLVGGAGLDILHGEGGADIFGFTDLTGGADQVRDFTLSGIDADGLNITDVLSGFGGGDDINDFVILNVRNSDRTDLFINADGAGNDWVQAATIRGSDFSGTTVDDLVVSGQLVTNQTLL